MPSEQPEQSPPLPRAELRGASRVLDALERAGNKLPDPAVLFVLLAAVVVVLSAALATLQFSEIDPRTKQPLVVHSQLSGKAITEFLSTMVQTFTGFPPLGVVLVALLGVGIAERSGFINAGLKKVLAVTPRVLLTPMLILVAIASHTAADAGYVLVIPLGGVIFQAAGRHPLAGIAAAFAGVSGGFSANFIPSSLDPLLQGLTQAGASILDPKRTVNPLCNWFFCSASCLVIVAVGWYITDRVIEPRVARTPVDAAPEAEQRMTAALTPREARALWLALASMAAGVALLVAASAPASSPLRAPSGQLTVSGAPLMSAIVPLIFLFFLVPGLVYGYAAGAFTSHRDVIDGMSKTMSTMAYYLVMAFFAAQFIYLFNRSNLGALLALKGAAGLQALALPSAVTIVGVILLTALTNILIGSASAKWALLAPILVPMLMSLGISPELTQAAYRIGDSTTNIISPLMVYFPLVVVFCQKYVKGTGIGTLVALMVPYSVSFLVAWTLFLLAYWQLGLPLGLDAPYVYP
ncbi:AbgT family transporter [Sorangium sp. So ce295]|uniref:AbgT family transporter n=1 Tax=Sorangium sp. So ce295 TaxID=3133295 RepID=UPI003F5F0375